MEAFLFYIAKVALALGAFYLAFLALFQNHKHFLFNRIYLPVSFLVSFLIPLITFTKVNYIQPIPAAASDSFAFLSEAAVVNEPQFTFEWYHYLLTIYALGIVAFLLNLLIGHLKAMSIIRFSRLKELFGARVNLTKKDVHPFSFFSRIVLSEKTLNNPSLKMIIDHEMVHVREGHTFDILIAELLFLLQWFNPFAWLVRDALRNNLEYLTDHQVVQNHNAETYQLAMVGLVHKKGVAPFLTALNGSQLKNRIIMMKKKTENRYSLLKQLVVLPMLAILVMGLSNKEVRTEVFQDAEHLKVVVDGVELPANHPDLNILDFSDGFDGGEVIKALGLEDKVVANTLSFDKNLKEDGVYSIETNDYEQGANPEFERMTSKVGAIENRSEIAAINPVELVTNTTAINGIVTDDAGKAIAGAQLFNRWGTLVAQTATDGKFSIDTESDDKAFIVMKSGYKSTQIENDAGKSKQQLLVQLEKTEKKSKNKVVKGKVTNDDGEGIPAVAVLVKGTKTGTMTDLSGNYELKTNNNSTLVFRMIGCAEKEVSVDGKSEIDVTLKTDGSGTPEQVKVIGYGPKSEAPKVELLGNSENPPLYIVDGKETGRIDDLEPDAIESISVLKNESATNLYGEKAKNGVILITTKAAAKAKQSKNLVIIDGKAFDGELSDIDPNSIESIDVLKETSAIETYGEEAKNGVIRINTKQQEITSYKDLRYSIAKSIRYPLVLSEANATGVSKIFVKVSNDGSIEVLDKKNIENAIPVDEVVVVGYRPQNVETAEIADAQKKFDQEAKRTIKQLPKISIPELKGETLLFTIKFMLQNKEE